MKHFIFPLLFIGAFIVVGDAPVRIGKEVVVEYEGIRIRSLKDCPLQPMPTLERHRFTRGDEVVEAYEAEKVWFHDQTVAYLSSQGITVYVAVPTLPAPSVTPIPCFYKGYTQPEHFEKWSSALKEKDDLVIDIIPWLEAYVGAKVIPSDEKIKASVISTSITRYELSSIKSARTFLYTVTDKKFPGRTIVVRYDFDRMDDYKKVERVVLGSITSIQFFEPVKKDAGDDKKRVTKGTVKNLEYSEKYQQSRQDVINGIKNLPGWWYLETKNFILVANMKRNSEIDRIQLEAEKIRDVYTKVLPPLVEIDDVSVIRVFGSREDYITYVGEDYRWTVGLWMSSKKELVISPVSWQKGKDRMDSLVRTLYHELFHQYIFYATGGCNPHPWFNEGLAQFFEDVEIRNPKRYVHDPAKRLQEDGHKASIAKFGNITIVKDMWYKIFQSEHRLSYPAVLSYMYFMVKGAPVLKNSNNYFDIPGRYYKALIETGDPEKANTIAWDGVDLEQFDKDYRNFWNTKSLFMKSRDNSNIPLLLKDAKVPEAESVTAKQVKK